MVTVVESAPHASREWKDHVHEIGHEVLAHPGCDEIRRPPGPVGIQPAHDIVVNLMLPGSRGLVVIGEAGVPGHLPAGLDQHEVRDPSEGRFGHLDTQGKGGSGQGGQQQ
eukprot:CAMPEP_0117657010 /NCGR_PEP_ID=MMETSP0804-20121206/5106_1 /TAXON_ID=1074897 /ORGANISM="Tetraselmis astigmatica, Strain CCMP880" /LENGTH=109 /DNA_ID=CAMNT_0005463443 /DNA_START=758 /DNA_END=1087 /DNA_ORIENTATION=+